MGTIPTNNNGPITLAIVLLFLGACCSFLHEAGMALGMLSTP
jgi:hypothetical protein